MTKNAPPLPRTRDDVRGATQKSAFSRSARRLASSDAAPAGLEGSENGLQAFEGPCPWPRTRDDVRGATQKSVVSRSARRLASSEAASYCDVPQCSPNSFSMAVWIRQTYKAKKNQPPEALTTDIAVNALSMSRVNFRPRPIGEKPNADGNKQS